MIIMTLGFSACWRITARMRIRALVWMRSMMMMMRDQGLGMSPPCQVTLTESWSQKLGLLGSPKFLVNYISTPFVISWFSCLKLCQKSYAHFWYTSCNYWPNIHPPCADWDSGLCFIEFEFCWKFSVFSSWSIWFVSFCLCLACILYLYFVYSVCICVW